MIGACHFRNFVDPFFFLEFFPVALSVIFLLVYAKCNFASVFLFCREKLKTLEYEIIAGFIFDFFLSSVHFLCLEKVKL